MNEEGTKQERPKREIVIGKLEPDPDNPEILRGRINLPIVISPDRTVFLDHEKALAAKGLFEEVIG